MKYRNQFFYLLFYFCTTQFGFAHEPAKALEKALDTIYKAQSLVFAFDASTSEKEQAEIECLLQRIRPKLEIAESVVREQLENSVGSGRDQVLQTTRDFIHRSSLHELGFAHFLRRLSYEENCKVCELYGFLSSGFALSFNPYSDQELAVFARKAKTEKRQNFFLSDLGLGVCSSEVQEPTTSYDWRNRNWIVGNLSEGEFVLTYDDGPHATLTEKIAEQWIESGQEKPTFFWLSENVLKQKNLVKDIYKKGFPIACHSERHADLGNLAKAGSKKALSSVNRAAFKRELSQIKDSEFQQWKLNTLEREIVLASDTIEGVLKEVNPQARIRHFRLPYGSGVRNGLIGDFFERRNLDHFFWKVDSLDWQDSNPDSIYNRVFNQMNRGKKGIILFHDIQPPTEKVTTKMIQLFRTKSNWSAVSIHKQVPN